MAKGRIARAGLILAMIAATGAGRLAAAPSDPVAGLKVDRVVLMMRHGVRPPSKAQPMPAGVTPDAWPSWPVKPGWLTPHGAAAIGALGVHDGASFRAQGLLPAEGCPAAGAVAIIADSDQRTIATAEAWKAALAPGCPIASTHKPQDEPDPLFSAIETGLSPYDPAQATAAVQAAAGPGGMAAVEAGQRPLLKRLDAILCGAARATCGVGHEATTLAPARANARPKLAGALDRASTAAQILLLEYADGKPMAEVGWGRATARDVTELSAFHALEFRLLARPPYIAAHNLAGFLPIIRDALSDKATGNGATITLISGHDTNVANLGGLLDVHWQVPGFAADDPAPGGAIILERLRGTDSALYVRALYRAQALDEIRRGAAGARRMVMPIPGCRALGVQGLCTLADFEAKLKG